MILGTCRLAGWLGRRFLGQTQVVMEMVAGVVLGPSLLGWLAPRLQASLFPGELVLPGGEVVLHPSRAVLFALAQLGLVLYMFLIGLELDVAGLRRQGRQAGAISIAGTAGPLLLGGALALVLKERRELFPEEVSSPAAALFLGAAMAITAFPMLARILHERGLAATPLGTTTLAAGALGDAIAWCLLAVVLGLLRDRPELTVITLVGGALYVIVLWTLGRRAFTAFGRRVAATGSLADGTFTGLLVVLAVCALVSELLGIHAVFGAFVVGAAMPRGELPRILAERTELLTTTLLLPIFFVYSGLSTELRLVTSPSLAGLALLIILTASLSKGLACTLAARWSGEGWRDAARIGTLMNARGLMELILLNIGLQYGVITPTLFTTLVLMAVVTTLMASPLFHLLSRPRESRRAPAPTPEVL